MGCHGGWPYKAIDFLHESWAATEDDYPYDSNTGIDTRGCRHKGTVSDVPAHLNI